MTTRAEAERAIESSELETRKPRHRIVFADEQSQFSGSIPPHALRLVVKIHIDRRESRERDFIRVVQLGERNRGERGAWAHSRRGAAGRRTADGDRAICDELERTGARGP